MEVYRAETQEILRLYINGQLTYTECSAGLDSALAAFVLRMDEKELPGLKLLL